MVIIWLMMVNNHLVGGIPTPLKNDGVKVSWDDDIPNNYMESHKIPWFQSTNQSFSQQWASEIPGPATLLRDPLSFPDLLA